WVAVTQRNFLVLPVSIIGGAVSFGFFLGCGMIIRCEEKTALKASACGVPSTANASTVAAAGAAAAVAAARKRSSLLIARPPRTAGLFPLVQALRLSCAQD
ncbi:unnamed protein product, partial [Polarella glacialis]